MGWFLYDKDVHHEIVKNLWEYKEFLENYQLLVKILETGPFFKKKNNLTISVQLSISMLPENVRKLSVFWRFQGV